MGDRARFARRRSVPHINRGARNDDAHRALCARHPRDSTRYRAIDRARKRHALAPSCRHSSSQRGSSLTPSTTFSPGRIAGTVQPSRSTTPFARRLGRHGRSDFGASGRLLVGDVAWEPLCRRSHRERQLSRHSLVVAHLGVRNLVLARSMDPTGVDPRVDRVRLALGPRLEIAGHSTGVPLPFAVLGKARFLDNVLPVRLSLYIALFVAVILTRSIVLARAPESSGRPRRPAVGWAVLALAIESSSRSSRTGRIRWQRQGRRISLVFHLRRSETDTPPVRSCSRFHSRCIRGTKRCSGS